MGILNSSDPAFTECPEAVFIVSKFNILKTFGAAYTMYSLEEERWLNLLYLGVCNKAMNTKQEFENARQQFYSKESYS